MNYMQRCVIQSGKATPTTAGVEITVGSTEKFAVYGIEATCMVAATGATHALKLFNSDGDVLAAVTIGGLTAGESARALVDAADAIIEADDYCYIGSIANDATASYSYRLIGSTPL